jgi:hypothetical protein
MGKHLIIFCSEWSETRCFTAILNPSLGLRKLRENGVRLKFNGTHHILVCAADVNV